MSTGQVAAMADATASASEAANAGHEFVYLQVLCHGLRVRLVEFGEV